MHKILRIIRVQYRTIQISHNVNDVPKIAKELNIKHSDVNKIGADVQNGFHLYADVAITGEELHLRPLSGVGPFSLLNLL